MKIQPQRQAKTSGHSTKRDRRAYGDWPPKKIDVTIGFVGHRRFWRRSARLWKKFGAPK